VRAQAMFGEACRISLLSAREREKKKRRERNTTRSISQ
jgi:hypothetical protein